MAKGKINGIIPHYCEAADLLICAALEWPHNQEHALILVTGAFEHPDMKELAAALNVMNNAARRRITIEQALDLSPTEEESEVEGKSPPHIAEPEETGNGEIQQAVSSVIKRLMTRERAAGNYSPEDPYSGPGGDEENNDILTTLGDEEGVEPEDTDFSDLNTDADIENLLNNPPEDEPGADPANPEELEENPAEASAEIGDDGDELSVENPEPEPDETSTFDDKIARLDAGARAIANRVSLKGDKQGRQLAREIITSNRQTARVASR